MDNFFWGAAASSHQVEGGNQNDWSEWEKKNAGRLSKESGGTYPPENYISGRACDHYNRYEEDFDIAKQLGHTAHRLSIEWSRIEPEEGMFDEKEIEHYRTVLRALRERGMEPFVTLWHWTLPLWVHNQGGWENKKTIGDFARYCNKISQSLENVAFWVTINEPTVYAGFAYIHGMFPPNVKSLWRSNMVLRNLLKAHRTVYDILHSVSKDASVGIAHNMHWHVPARSGNALDALAVRMLDYIRDRWVVEQIKNHQDFVGLNYYFRDTVRFVWWGGKFGPADIQNTDTYASDIGWAIVPEGLYYILIYLKKYNKPIYITENGIADRQDEYRAEFIKEHVRWMQKAQTKGVDIRGYFYWSLLDNFEWDKGFWPRFGLVEVDYTTMERRIRASAWEYKKIIQELS